MARSLTNAYWIHVGELRERERIIALLQEQTAHDENDDLMLAEYWETIVALIKGENE
jgi:hypothetical protein